MARCAACVVGMRSDVIVLMILMAGMVCWSVLAIVSVLLVCTTMCKLVARYQKKNVCVKPQLLTVTNSSELGVSGMWSLEVRERVTSASRRPASYLMQNIVGRGSRAPSLPPLTLFTQAAYGSSSQADSSLVQV